MGHRVWHKYENEYVHANTDADGISNSIGIGVGMGFYGRSLPREEWRQEKESHPAIISQEMYEQVQSLHPPTTSFGKKKGRRHLFHGLTKCGVCGKALCRQKSGRQVLVCRQKHREGEVNVSVELLWEICDGMFRRGEKRVRSRELKELFLNIFFEKIVVGADGKMWIYCKVRNEM
jgi:hypothetical protein